LIAFINGQTGTTNPQRQGLNAALFDGHSPLNILKEIPEPTAQFDYSPLWDIHLVRWNDTVLPVVNRLRQTDFATAQNAGWQPGAESHAIWTEQYVRCDWVHRELPRREPGRQSQPLELQPGCLWITRRARSGRAPLGFQAETFMPSSRLAFRASGDLVIDSGGCTWYLWAARFGVPTTRGRRT